MIRKIVIAVVAIVVLIAAGLLAATLLIDPNKFKGQIEQAAEEATGRKLSMVGKIGLNLFSLTPSLSVADVSLANASWGSRPEMLKFKKLSAEVQLIPLLSSKINVNQIQLDGADILLETGKDGTGNWVFAPAKAAPAPAEAPKDAKASAPPAIAVAATGRKIDVGALMQQPGKEKLIDGMADLDINLAGSGASMAAIAGGLNGRTQVSMGESRLNNKYLRIVAGDLFKIIDPWAAKEDTGKINCVLSKFDIKSGVATSQAMVVDGAAFAVLGDGKINLGPETLDLLIDAKPKNNSLLSVAVPVRVGGTLMNPSFSPDPGAAIKGLVGAAGGILGKGAGAATGGGLLGGAAGNVLGGVLGGQQAQPAQPQQQAAADGGSGACGANLKAGAAQPAAQPTQPAAAPAQNPASAPTAPSNPVDALGKGVKGLLKP